MMRTGSRLRRALGLCVAVMLVTALTPVMPAVAATAIYVDAVDGDDATGAGTLANPYQSITRAMTASSAGTTIYAQPGIYDTTVEADFPILVKPGVQIVALEGPTVTTIDANATDRVIEFTDSVPGTGIAGFKIQDGRTVSAGAGILISQHLLTAAGDGWPLIMDCYIEHCQADGPGGGMMVWGADATHLATPVIIGCAFNFNAAGPTYQGGGIYVDRGEPSIWSSSMSSNTAGYGGGLWANRAVDLDRCGVWGNTAQVDAGGALLGKGSTIGDCTVAGNRAVTGDGGGLFLDYGDGTYSVHRTIIEFNTAGSDGGGVMIGTATLAAFENVEITKNGATGDGAAIYFDPQAGIYELSLDGCTLTDNTAGGWDGVYLPSPAHATITSSIVNHDVGDIDDAEDISGAYTMSYSNTHDQDLTGTGVNHADPQFIDTSAGNYELVLGSPCIDTGDPASALFDDVLGRMRPEDGDGNGAARADIGAYERPLPDVARISGENRFDTAGIMAQWREWGGTTAVLASGMGFADALSGSGLAGALYGPLLITNKDVCPGIVFDALQDAGIDDVVIVGGTGVVSDSVKAQLEAEGYRVTRVAGADRYATAAAVAAKIAEIRGSSFAQTAFVARGDEFADALAASPIAYSQAMPVLLTATGSLPDATRNAITSLGIDDVVVVGGKSAVSQPVQDAIEGLPGVEAMRVAAGDRYATAVEIAKWAEPNGYTDWGQVGIATGTNFPDALAGGALCGVRYGVLLLTQPNALPTATRDALIANKRSVVYCEVYGGKLAVTEAVRAQINAALGW